MLTDILGTSVAPVAFALALICSGQSSTITGTLAGQITMEGFLRLRHAALAAADDHARCWPSRRPWR